MHPIRLEPEKLDIRKAIGGSLDLARLASATREDEPDRVATLGGQPGGVHHLTETLLHAEVPGVQDDLAISGQPNCARTSSTD